MKSQSTMSKPKKTANEKIPGDIFHPGEFIKDELLARGMGQSELVEKIKLSKWQLLRSQNTAFWYWHYLFSYRF